LSGFRPAHSHFFESPASIRNRFVAALIAAVVSGMVCIATLAEPQWLELLLDDGGDGSLETICTVGISLAACLLFGLLAWRAWRRGQREAARAVIVKDLA